MPGWTASSSTCWRARGRAAPRSWFKTGAKQFETQAMRMEIHQQSLEEASTQVGGEARMLLPGVQTLAGLSSYGGVQPGASSSSPAEQILHFSGVPAGRADLGPADGACRL
jgi:hypothetical protein